MNWFAVYTNPRAEKKAYAELISKGIDAYLPLLKTLKQWSDRKKWVEEPLFRSYIFINIPQSSYYDVLNTPGIVRYVTFEGKAVPIPPRQIDAIRYFLAEELNAGELPATGKEFIPGDSVEITRGPLRGLSGQLVDVQGHQKVRIEIEALGQSVFVTIPASQLEVVR